MVFLNHYQMMLFFSPCWMNDRELGRYYAITNIESKLLNWKDFRCAALLEQFTHFARGGARVFLHRAQRFVRDGGGAGFVGLKHDDDAALLLVEAGDEVGRDGGGFVRARERVESVDDVEVVEVGVEIGG